MAEILEKVLEGNLNSHDLVSWLISNKIVVNKLINIFFCFIYNLSRNMNVSFLQESSFSVFEDIQSLKPIFIPYFINYVRDQAQILLNESRSSSTTPAKTPLSSKFKRQLSKDHEKSQRNHRQKKSSNRVNLFPESSGIKRRNGNFEQPLHYGSAKGPGHRATHSTDNQTGSQKSLKYLDSPKSR